MASLVTACGRRDEATRALDSFMASHTVQAGNQHFFILQKELPSGKDSVVLTNAENLQMMISTIEVSTPDRKNGIEERRRFIISSKTYRQARIDLGVTKYEPWSGGNIFGGTLEKISGEWKIQTKDLNPYWGEMGFDIEVFAPDKKYSKFLEMK